MSNLRRIVLLHAHLPGVVELQLDQHTNICGTNASGKTTLQRLIPVFYGEQPNRVVPKTRKKFDEFYLPHANSYIVYEYQRESGDICQVVLTRRGDGGIDYRFVAAAYDSQQYLTETQGQVKALGYQEWAQRLRELGHKPSPKLSATSEYRSVIQNDASLLRGNNSESAQLRRLAMQFSLVAQGHKLRHIEKLVSAVHAKEGKMDTLKAMLAAIFEEDGVVLPTTRIKNTKAREWIKQMRQSMRLARLQKDFDGLAQLARQLESTEQQLKALLPLLRQDESDQLQLKADAEQQLHACKRALDTLEADYETQKRDWQDQLSQAEINVKSVGARLSQLQATYDDYEQSDMPQLLNDVEALPLWRESLLQLQEQYQLMVEAHGDLEQQLNQRKTQLSEALDRLSETVRAKVRQLQQQKDQLREQQQQQLAHMEQAFAQQLAQIQQQVMAQTTTLSSEIAVIESRLASALIEPSETEALHENQVRLEQAQLQVQTQGRQVQQLQRAYQSLREEREKADEQLIEARRQLQHAQQAMHRCQQLLNPKPNSLRAFLRDTVPDWEMSVGKVIHADLLERTDLAPQFVGQQTGIFGVTLNTAFIDIPDYALDEERARAQLQLAQQQVNAAEEAVDQHEKLLRAAHERVEQQRVSVEQAEWQLTQFEQQVEYARDARQRLQAQIDAAVMERKVALQNALLARQQQLQTHLKQAEQDRDERQQDFVTQKMEFKADWQAALAAYDEQIDGLEQQLQRKREDNRAQLAELQQAFNEELSAKGIDPRRLSELKAKQDALRAQIQVTESRSEVLKQWQSFMKVEWQQVRPALLTQETEFKQLVRDAKQQLATLKSVYEKEQQKTLTEKRRHAERMSAAESLLKQIAQALTKLQEVAFSSAIATDTATSDVVERLTRVSEGLEQRAKLDAQLKAGIQAFEGLLSQDASVDFLDRFEHEKRLLPEHANTQQYLGIISGLLRILQDAQQQLLEMGENIGGDLKKFFTVFSDINRRIALQSKRLSDAVTDDLQLEGIRKSEVRILSTIDELGFWQPLKQFSQLYDAWTQSGKALPSDEYLNALADVVELLRSDEQYSMESLLRLELHLNEGGTDLVIRNDRQLLESSSHGMAYLILCKYLLAFTRLLRGPSSVSIHWPIDEIGTLAYHNVERLFQACTHNNIVIVGAFPNPESDVLMLFEHRYLIEPLQDEPSKRQLKRIQPKVSRLSEKLQQRQQGGVR